MAYKKTIYLCFRRVEAFRWWQIFTGKKRQHIFIIFSCNKNNSVIIDVVEGGIALYHHNESARKVANTAKKNGSDVIKCISRGEGFDRQKLKIMRTCVSIAKDILGIRCWWIQTPEQLYLYLKNKEGMK